MSDRYASEVCEDCDQPMDDHRRDRVRQEDGQYVFKWWCPE